MKKYVSIACVCHMGKKRRSNEDNFYVNGRYLPLLNEGLEHPLAFTKMLDQSVLLGVFDGMGGEQCGELASFTAASTAHEIVCDLTPESPIDADHMVRQLNNAVLEKAQKEKILHMGTTVAMVIFSGKSVQICNLGDSRIYRLRDQELCQLSEDHVSMMLQLHQKKPPLLQYLGMNPAEVQIEPFIAEEPLAEGDAYLLCSDGITDMLPDSEICRILRENRDPLAAAAKLQECALECGGIDNLTAAVCRICVSEDDAQNTDFVRTKEHRKMNRLREILRGLFQERYKDSRNR